MISNLGEWTTDLPAQSGWYWIKTIPEFEEEAILECVFVCVMNGKISFDIPCGGYECEDMITPERTTHWLRIVDIPKMP